MGRQIILSEEEKRTIQGMYGLVNEQPSTEGNFENFVREELVPMLRRLGFKKAERMSDVYEDGGFKFEVRNLGPTIRQSDKGGVEPGVYPGVKISSSFDVTPLITNKPETEWSDEEKEMYKKEELIEYNIKYIDWFSNQDGKTWFDKKTNTYHSRGIYLFSETGTNNLKESLDSMEETFKRLRDINNTI